MKAIKDVQQFGAEAVQLEVRVDLRCAVSVDLRVLLNGGAAGTTKGEVRMAKVLRLRAAIQKGHYNVDAGEVADCLLRRAGRVLDSGGTRYSA